VTANGPDGASRRTGPDIKGVGDPSLDQVRVVA